MKKQVLPVVFVALALVMLESDRADAAPILMGQVVETTYLFPNMSTIFAGPTQATVGAGAELFQFAGFADIDFSDTNILITPVRDAGVNNVAFDGFKFSDVNGTIPAFTTVLLNPATTYAGFDSSRITFDADNIFVNVANLPGLNGQVISIDLVRSSAPVPEPATMWLLGSGVAVLAARRRKKAPR